MKVVSIIVLFLAGALASPRGHHPGLHRGHQKQHMGLHLGRPTGQPMMPHMGRPTGQPMNPHKHVGKNSQFWKHRKERINAWRQMHAKQDEDETEVLSSSLYEEHMAAFQKEIDDLLMGDRPTGRPAISELIDQIKKKYKDARANMQALRPTGSPGKKAHMKKLNQLKKMFKKIKMQLNNPQTDEDETEVLSSSAYDDHMAAFQKEIDVLMMGDRPTGRPAIKALMKQIRVKFMEAKKNMQSLKPTGRPGIKAHMKKMNELKKMFNNIRMQVKKPLTDVDETEVLSSSPYDDHMAAFQKEIDVLMMGDRPTGRPAIMALLKQIRKKFKDAKKNMQALKPTGRPGLKAHMKKINELKGMFKNLKMQLTNPQTDEDETEVLNLSTYKGHMAAFKKILDDLMMGERPTGKPAMKAFMKNMRMKLQEAVKNMNSLRPTGRPGLKAHQKQLNKLRKMFNKARMMVKKPKDDNE